MVLAASTSAFAHASLQEALQGVRAAGYRHVEIACIRGMIEHVRQEEMTSSRAAEVRCLADAAGLRMVALSAHMDLAGEGALEDFAARLDFAAALGVRFVNTNISPPERRDVFLRHLRELGPRARALRLTLCIEAPGTLLPGSDEYRELLERLGDAPVALNFDVGNVLTASLGAADPVLHLEAVYDAVAHLHVKDVTFAGDTWGFAPLGDGVLDWPRLFAFLRRAGRVPPITVEMPLALTGKGAGKGAVPAKLAADPVPYDAAVEGLRRSREFLASGLGAVLDVVPDA